MAPGRMGCQIEVDTLVEFSESIQANRGLTKVSPALVCCRLHVVVYVACCIRVAVCAPSRGTLSCDRLASAAVARVLTECQRISVLIPVAVSVSVRRTRPLGRR